MSKLELHHKSVMCEEVLSILNPTDDCIYVDGTLGAGGHTRRILEEADCKVIGIDKDPVAISLCNDIKANHKNNFFTVKIKKQRLDKSKEIIDSGSPKLSCTTQPLIPNCSMHSPPPST